MRICYVSGKNTETKMQSLGKTLEKKKSNRHQLQREYTKLGLEYQNLTTQYSVMSAKYSNLSLTYDLLLKQYSLLEDRLNNLAQETSQMNQSLLLSVTTNHADLLELRQKQSKNLFYIISDVTFLLQIFEFSVFVYPMQTHDMHIVNTYVDKCIHNILNSIINTRLEIFILVYFW